MKKMINQKKKKKKKKDKLKVKREEISLPSTEDKIKPIAVESDSESEQVINFPRPMSNISPSL